MTPSSPLTRLFSYRALEIAEKLRQANHLVNPRSGIANDFLNQYNEILLLVENLPVLLPEMIDELLAWSARTYEQYFRSSPLPGGELAIEIYQALDPAFRAEFEAQVSKINVIADKAIEVLAKERDPAEGMKVEAIEAFCEAISAKLREEIEKASVYVNHGWNQAPETPQEMADRLMHV